MNSQTVVSIIKEAENLLAYEDPRFADLRISVAQRGDEFLLQASGAGSEWFTDVNFSVFVIMMKAAAEKLGVDPNELGSVKFSIGKILEVVEMRRDARIEEPQIPKPDPDRPVADGFDAFFGDIPADQSPNTVTVEFDLDALAAEFLRISGEIGNLLVEKNKAYGYSFQTAGHALAILYPNGIRPDQYVDALCIVRIWDKLMRIATDRDALGESPYRDVAGYAILGAEMVERSRMG
jgi:hypothetical protein